MSTRQIILSIVLSIFLFLNSSFSQSMKVHTNSGTDVYNLADIDSITFNIQNESPMEGLVAYYTFNGNANDESGNGNNGTIIGAALSSEGIIGTSLAFSNDSDNVMTGVNLSTTVFTLNIWAKQTVPENISLGGTLTNPSFGKSGFMFHSGGYAGAEAGSAAILSWQGNQVWINFYGTEPVIVSDWNMYTFIYVAGDTSKIYSNGVLTATLPNTPTNPTHSSPFQIHNDYWCQPSLGRLDRRGGDLEYRVDPRRNNCHL